MRSTTVSTSNWKNPWFCLVLGLPLAAVLACVVTLYLAIRSSDGVVSDDYYKEGLAINQDLQRDEQARTYGLKGQLSVNGNWVELQLHSNASAASLTGQPLQLLLENMGLAARDQKIVLLPTGQAGIWRGTLQQAPTKGLWRVHVQTQDWRLLADVKGDFKQPIALQ